MVLSGSHAPPLDVAAPIEYGGPGRVWTPEHLLLASVASCLLFTWKARAGHGSLPFSSLEVRGSGTVDRVQGVTRFTEIVLHARLTVPEGTDVQRALQILEKSESTCLVSASLATPVHLVPEVVVAADACLSTSS
jgi:uncharacterized OsmC-like protein